jgi:hypothetical protein
MTFAHEINYQSQEALDAARAATRDKYTRIFSKHIEEGARRGETPLEAMDFAVWFNRTTTPEENLEYRWAFEPLGTKVQPWKKWGGGNKMGSAGASINAARKARHQARQSAPDANVNNYVNKNLADRLGLTALSNFVDSRLNATQGKNVPSNPSWGFSQQTLNATGARGADPSFAGEAGRSVYGKPSTVSSTNASFSSPSSSSLINTKGGSGSNFNSPKNFVTTSSSPQSFGRGIGDILHAERSNMVIGPSTFALDYSPYYNFGTFG